MTDTSEFTRPVAILNYDPELAPLVVWRDTGEIPTAYRKRLVEVMLGDDPVPVAVVGALPEPGVNQGVRLWQDLKPDIEQIVGLCVAVRTEDGAHIVYNHPVRSVELRTAFVDSDLPPLSAGHQGALDGANRRQGW